MTTKRYKRISNLACPACSEIGTLRKIIYGIPGSDFDFEKYAVGGCVIEPMQPDIACRECGWRGHRDSLEDL